MGGLNLEEEEEEEGLGRDQVDDDDDDEGPGWEEEPATPEAHDKSRCAFKRFSCTRRPQAW